MASLVEGCIEVAFGLKTLKIDYVQGKIFDCSGFRGKCYSTCLGKTTDRTWLVVDHLRTGGFFSGLSSRAFGNHNLKSKASLFTSPATTSLILLQPDLSELQIHSRILCDAGPIKISFHLRKLVLGSSYFPLAFIVTLFKQSAASLVELTLSVQRDHSIELREVNFPVSHRQGDSLLTDRDLQLLDVCIGRCQNLRMMTEWGRIGINTINLLRHLPPSLEVFNTSFPINDVHTIPKFSQQIPSDLRRLREVRLLTMTRKELEGHRWGRDMRDELNRRGIQVRFGFGKSMQESEFITEVST